MKSLLLIQPNSLLKKFYPKALWNLDRTHKTIYLTFDDGPVPQLSEWVLEELEKYNAAATFFCVGANIEKYPQIFQRIKDEGHRVANHTMFHKRGFRVPVPDYLEEVNNCKK